MKKNIFHILIFLISNFNFLVAQQHDTVNSSSIKTTESHSLFNVYPNPKDETFQIVYGSNNQDPPIGWGGKLTITIKNSTGKIVYSERILDFEGDYNKTIDLSNEEKGNYIIEIMVGDEGQFKKEIFVRSTVAAEEKSPVEEELTDGNSLLNVFPNPTDGTFQIIYGSTTNNPPDGWGGELVISVMDPYGKTVYSETILNFEGEYNKTIDLSSAEKGIYLIEVASGKQGKTKREILK